MYRAYITFFNFLKIFSTFNFKDALKLLFKICDRSGLRAFAIEPSLIRALRAGSEQSLEFWEQAYHSSVALGVIEAGLDHLV